MKYFVEKTPLFFRTAVGIFLLVVGMIFLIIPGPAILFLPLGLAILSIDNPKAKVWLRRCQRMMSRSARQIDAWLLRRKR